jgi:hypothetical protein
MPQMQTINLMQPIATACVVDATQWRVADCGSRIEPTAASPKSAIRPPPSEDLSKELQQQRDELARRLETVSSIAGGLATLHEQMLASNRVEIAKLAVEIARKILMYKVGKKDYEIQAVVRKPSSRRRRVRTWSCA